MDSGKQPEEPRGVARFALRRRVLVDRRLQMRLIGSQLTVFGFTLIALAAGMFYPVLTQLSGPASSDGEVVAAAEAMLYLHERLWPVLGCVAVFLVLALLRITHQIAGPLIRIRRFIRDLTVAKNTDKLKIRKHDYLQEEVDLLNELRESLMRRDTERAELIRRVEDLEQRLRAVPGLVQGDRSSLCAVASEIREVAESHERYQLV